MEVNVCRSVTTRLRGELWDKWSASAQRPNALSGIYGGTTTGASNNPLGPEFVDFSQGIPQLRKHLEKFE